MSIQFRPSVGPFVRVPSGRPGGIAYLLTLIFFITVVWPVQLVWLLCKAIVLLLAKSSRRPVVTYRGHEHLR